MKRNNGSENHADGPKETFRSRRHQRHPEAHINLRGKQQGLDTGSKQSGFAALILEKSNVEQLHSFRKCVDSPPQKKRKKSSITPAYRYYREDSHLCKINTCIVANSSITPLQSPSTLHIRPLTSSHKTTISFAAQVKYQTLVYRYRYREISQLSRVMPNSCNTICTRQQG